MNKRIWIPLAVGLAVALFLRARSASASTGAAGGVVKRISIALDAEQRQNATLIETKFRAAGLPDNLIAAAIVNAYAESKLHATAVGDSGRSVGLFQLNDNGAGSGLTTEYRLDPSNNIDTILTRELFAKFGETLRGRAAMSATVYELAQIFSRDIERPGDTAGCMAARAALSLKMFPIQ